MKLLILQPDYPRDGTAASAVFCLDWMLAKINSVRPGDQDLILLPEYANAPGIGEREALRQFAGGRGSLFLDEIADCAKRLECSIALGAVRRTAGRWANHGLLFDSTGKMVYSYEKTHLTGVEIKDMGISPGASPAVFEHQGVRLAFGICFDLYFPEYFAALAAQRVDLILCPSYQRSESVSRIALIARARALDSGAYLARSSYAMGGTATGVGGHSLVAAPDGALLADAGSGAGVIAIEIDPGKKFVRPASFGQPPVEHRALLDGCRRPGLYRPSWERKMRVAGAKFPRICAHRGLSLACPENTLPAFAAAVASGAEEMEFDLWMSRDGAAVVCHDKEVDRTTDGRGDITKMSWAEIRRLDAGVRLGDQWRGVRIPSFEEVLDLVDGRIGLNIHIKDAGPGGQLVKNVCDLLRKQALLDIAYIAGCTEAVLQAVCDYAPEVQRACLLGQEGPSGQVKMAKKYSCRRIQFGRNVKDIHTRAAHDEGIICNLFWSDDAAEAAEYVKNGIDVVLTNCAQKLISDGFPAVR